MEPIEKIAFFGFADAKENDEVFREAFLCAKLLAKNGYVIVNGGGPGVMRAATLGARESGGKTIGVTFYPKEIASFEGRDEKNPVEEEIVTKNYLERTLKLLEIGDAYIVFRGGTGTISEFAMSWGLARLYFGHHKPLILYGQFWNEVISAFRKHMRIRPIELKVFRIVNSPEEVPEVLSYFREVMLRKKHRHIFEKAFQL